MSKIFQYQGWHLLALVFLLVITATFVSSNADDMQGMLWGIGTLQWFWIAIAVPIVHQVYVWLIWRLELYQNTFSSRLGVSEAFQLYAAGFSILFVGRLIAIIFVAISSRDTLVVYAWACYLLAALITPPVIYLFYSVKRYFTVERAFGIDHFDKNYNEPYVKGGIFRFTGNGMYVYGLMILYLPGLLLLSKPALVVGLFNHVYIWVHYYCTEQPDMKTIYEELPDSQA